MIYVIFSTTLVIINTYFLGTYLVSYHFYNRKKKWIVFIFSEEKENVHLAREKNITLSYSAEERKSLFRKIRGSRSVIRIRY